MDLVQPVEEAQPAEASSLPAEKATNSQQMDAEISSSFQVSISLELLKLDHHL